MVHFTYSDSPDFDTLCQGDILKKSPELCAVINQVHPHYGNEDYTHFQILTQSCDLVRRDGSNCSSRYITLAAIRPLRTALSRAVAKYCPNALRTEERDFLPSNKKQLIESYLAELLNNNNKELFYLKEFPEKDLLQDSCTFLHLSVALKSELHYETCLKAKIIQLEPNFQSKLGWLVGNLYSRVATIDYNDALNQTKKEFKEDIERLLQDYAVVVEQRVYSKFKQAFEAPGTDEIENILKIALSEADQEDRNKKKQKIDSVLSDIKSLVSFDNQTEKKLRNLLANNSTILYGLKGKP